MQKLPFSGDNSSIPLKTACLKVNVHEENWSDNIFLSSKQWMSAWGVTKEHKTIKRIKRYLPLFFSLSKKS